MRPLVPATGANDEGALLAFQPQQTNQDTPIVCPHCGIESPNEFLNDLNHRPMGTSGLCTSQFLRRNQFIYSLQTPGTFDPAECAARLREVGLDPAPVARENGYTWHT